MTTPTSAAEAVSGVPSEVKTDAAGTVHGPNGTPMGKAAKDPRPVSKQHRAAAKAAKPAAKKPAVAKVKAAAKVEKPGRTTGATGKSAGERRLLIVKVLRKMGAVSPGSARTAEDVAAKCGLTRFDVYGQLYHTHKLQAEGFARQVETEGVRGLTYYLTAKGVKATDEQITG